MTAITIVDARGLRCPIPVIRLARQAQALAPGDRVTVWSSDPAAVYDVPAWARMRGHTIEESIDVVGDVGGDEHAEAHVEGNVAGTANGAPNGGASFRAITVRIGG